MMPIKVEQSNLLPLVDFRPDGNLLIEGRVISENLSELFESLIGFAVHLEVPQAVFNVNLEYFNTPGAKKMLDLFRTLDGNDRIGKLLIVWHYEDGDEDSAEMAEMYAENLSRADFRIVSHPESILTIRDKKSLYV